MRYNHCPVCGSYQLAGRRCTYPMCDGYVPLATAPHPPTKQYTHADLKAVYQMAITSMLIRPGMEGIAKSYSDWFTTNYPES